MIFDTLAPKPIVPALVIFLSSAQSYAAPNIIGLEVSEVAQNTGYTVSEIERYFPPIEEWNQYGLALDPMAPAPDFAGERFSHMPEPYVHPRIYFSPEDLPALRENLETVHIRKMQMGLLRSRCLQLAPTPEAWEAMGALREPEFTTDKNGKFMIRVRRHGFRGPWFGGWVNDLAEGRGPEVMQGKWHLHPNKSKENVQIFMNTLPYEALRCLLDEDAESGQRLAAALTTLAGLYAEHMDQWQATDDWQNIYQIVGSANIAICYDLLYNFMTPEQQDTVRSYLTGITRGKTSIGFEHLPAFPGGTSNWNTIHMHLAPIMLAIQGEEGYDPSVYAGCVETMKKWCYVATGPLGAPFEGYNKSSYAAQHLLTMARNGDRLIGTQWVKNAGSIYHLGVMAPHGQFIYYTQSEGLPRDYYPFKYAYPEDPLIDIIYAATVKDWYGDSPRLEWDNARTTYMPDHAQFLFLDDPIGAENGQYDYEAQLKKFLESLRSSENSTLYFSDYRGIMITRSSWEPDAAFLLFEPRHVPGGHTVAAHGDFYFASHGRSWSKRPTINSEGGSETRSVMLINGVGQGHQTVQTKSLALEDTETATIHQADLTWAYSYRAGDPKRDESIQITPNESRLEASRLPWMDQPWSFLPGWRDGKKGGDRHGHWAEHIPMEYVVRTVVLGKSDQPYVLIRDDAKRDGETHEYAWQMQVEDDLEVIQPAARNDDGGIDMILGDAAGRRLLVRLLEAGEAGAVMPESFALESYEYSQHRGNISKSNRLLIRVKGEIGNFTVLLYPHFEGDPMPEMEFEDSELTIKTQSFRHSYQLTRNSQGISQVTQID